MTLARKERPRRRLFCHILYSRDRPLGSLAAFVKKHLNPLKVAPVSPRVNNPRSATRLGFMFDP